MWPWSVGSGSRVRPRCSTGESEVRCVKAMSGKPSGVPSSGGWESGKASTCREPPHLVRWRLDRMSVRSCPIEGNEPVTSTETEKVSAWLKAPISPGHWKANGLQAFLDHVPIAIAVSELVDPEVIVYANPEFERVSGIGVSALERKYWDILTGEAVDEPSGLSLVTAIVERSDRVGRFKMQGPDDPVIVDLHSNVIEDDAGTPTYRLVALVNAEPSGNRILNLSKPAFERRTRSYANCSIG